MSDVETATIAQFLEAVLRGAAKLVGCGSTSLILFDENAQTVRVHLGITADSFAVIDKLEALLGSRFRDIAWPMGKAEGSLTMRAWRQARYYETSSVAELFGAVLSPVLVGAVGRLVGDHRFACVPALSSTRNYGVLLFQKEGLAPYNRQQREVLLRYARRIAEILENDLVRMQQTLLDQLPEATSLENQLVRLTLGDPAPALFVDPDLRITSCNAATAQLLGCDGRALSGKPIGTLFTARDDVDGILRHQTLASQRSSTDHATMVSRRDGSLIPVRVEALLLADDVAQPVGFMLVLRPRAKRESDHLITQERLATMGEMAAQLAHEIRNPLVAVGATLESLMRDADTPESQRDILKAVVKEIVRMDTKLKDYLAARHEMSMRQVCVGTLVEDARRLLESAHRMTGKTIRCHVTPEMTMHADYEAMKQVVFNLLLNAIEATQDAGEIVCRAAKTEYEVAITVEDRGFGLQASPEDCLRPFFTTKKNGTGLGLAVCQKIARAHGGFVDLRNREGGGCRATVVLPTRSIAQEATA